MKLLTKPKYFLLIPVCLFIIVEILLLRPASLERTEDESQSMYKSIASLVEAQRKKDEASYSVVGFHYTASEGESKNWEIFATEAVLYAKSRTVLARHARILMFDPKNQITYIDGDQAFYNLNTKDIDLEGNVKVTFPDGFWVKTTRAHYSALKNTIYSEASFHGEAVPNKGEIMHISGRGFTASKQGPDIYVLNEAHARLRRLEQDEITDVRSDLATVNRASKSAQFTMSRLDRFVESMQGSLRVRSRRQEATYDSVLSHLKFLTAYDDVLIQETDPEKVENGLKYATCQKADFLTQESKIILTGFPSAYQGSDILTGELIIVYRDKNLIEVMQANAFHPGKQ